MVEYYISSLTATRLSGIVVWTLGYGGCGLGFESEKKQSTEFGFCCIIRKNKKVREKRSNRMAIHIGTNA